MTNEEVFGPYLAWLALSHPATTVSSYEYALRHLRRWLEAERRMLTECDLNDLCRYQEHLRVKGLKPSTQNLYATALRAVWKWMRRQGLVSLDEALIPMPRKEDVESFPCMRVEDLDRMLATFDENLPKGLRDKTIVRFLFLTGVRGCELRSIDAADVDLDEMKARVKTFKARGAGKMREIHWDEETNRLLGRWMGVRRSLLQMNGRGSEALFVSLSTSNLGDRIQKHALVNIFTGTRRRLGMTKKISTHSARHGHGTFLAEMGMDVWKLKEDMGHATLRSTQVYVHIGEKERQDAHRQCFDRLGV